MYRSIYLKGNKVDSAEPAGALYFVFHTCSCTGSAETKPHCGSAIVGWKFSQLGLLCALYPSDVTERKTDS